MNKQEQKRLLEVAKKINETAQHVYSVCQGATDLNFFKCRLELEDGRIGWIRECRSLEAAISIYELYTYSEGQDIYEEIIEAFPEIGRVNNLDEIKI